MSRFTYVTVTLLCLIYIFIIFHILEASTYSVRNANNIVIADGDDALVDSNGEIYYTRSQRNLVKTHANADSPEKCQFRSQEIQIVVSREGIAYECHSKGKSRDECGIVSCGGTQNSSLLSRNATFATARFGVTDEDSGKESIVIYFQCTLETPVVVSLQSQVITEITVELCQIALPNLSWNSALHKPLYSFRYFDDRYSIVTSQEVDGTSSAQLVLLENHNGQYIWRAQSTLSCRAMYHSVIRSYTCATAAVMVESDLLPENTLFVAFYYGEESSCENAQNYDEYHESLNGGRTVVCGYPMSHSEKNIRAEGQEVLHLERTHTFQMKFTTIDEQPMLIFLEHRGFYVYDVATELPQHLINSPAYGHWKAEIRNATSVFLTKKREAVVTTFSSVMAFDLDACSKASSCNECMAADHLYCGWCILEKKCSTLHGCSSAVKHPDITKRLWLHAKRHINRSCPRLSPYIAGTTMSREAVIKSINKSKSEFIFSGSQFPLKGAYADEISCRMTVSKNNSYSYLSLPAQRPKFRHNSLHAEFRCPYPNEIVNLISNISSYHDTDTGFLELAVTLSYSQKSRLSHKIIDLKTVTVSVVLCETLSCIQCAKVSEACSWNLAKNSCVSLLRTSPEEVTKFEQDTTNQHCNSSESIVDSPRVPHLHTNLPIQLPKNFSCRPITFLGENLDMLNVTTMDTSVGTCSITYRDVSNITCLMSGEFVRENVTIRIYTDDRTTICSHCRFELFEEDKPTTPLTTGVTSQTKTTTYALFHKPEKLQKQESTKLPDESSAFFSGVYLLIFISVAGVLLVAVLVYFARVQYLTKKNSGEAGDRQKETHPLVQQVHPPPVPPRNTAPIETNNSYLSCHVSQEDSGLRHGSLSQISIPDEEAPHVAAHLYESVA